MAVLYRGFTIGNVKSYHLNANDNVEAIFLIYEQYLDRVKYGSLVELMISPIGLGNQFLFHPGKGGMLLQPGDFVPDVNSEQGQDRIAQGLVDEPRHDDSISLLLNRASTVLDSANRTLRDVNEAIRTGSDATTIGKIVGSVQRTMADVETIPGTVNRTADAAVRDMGELLIDIDDIKAALDNELARLNPIISDINALTTKLNDPEGLVYTVLDTDGAVYTELAKSLSSISGILDNLDRTTEFIPGQMPALAGMITDLRVTLKTAEDVLVALTNNPLLRKGIPEQVEVQSSGTSPRDIQF
jgi:phospholipid/cholesterol/gamma-HCH transport system substrate-binding protein